MLHIRPNYYIYTLINVINLASMLYIRTIIYPCLGYIILISRLQPEENLKKFEIWSIHNVKERLETFIMFIVLMQ